MRYAGATRRGLRACEESPPPPLSTAGAQERTAVAADRTRHTRHHVPLVGPVRVGVGLLPGHGTAPLPPPVCTVQVGVLSCLRPVPRAPTLRGFLVGLRDLGDVESRASALLAAGGATIVRALGQIPALTPTLPPPVWPRPGLDLAARGLRSGWSVAAVAR